MLEELSRDEKKSFWVVASFITMVDGVLQDEEKVLLDEFNREMGTSYEEIHPSRNDFRKEIDNLKNSTEKVRKIVYFKIFGLAFSDDEFTIDEQRMIELTRKEFSISESDGSVIEEFAKGGSGTGERLMEVLEREGA